MKKTVSDHNPYIGGNTAKKLEIQARAARESRRQEKEREQQNYRTIKGGLREKTSRKGNILQLTFMVCALIASALIMYQYVRIQSGLESSVTTIASLEKQLAALRQENDEAYSRANSKVDLEEVKRVAIQELGMKYADEGQIVVYSDEGAEDYVRQIAQIPEAGK